jgi:molybdopterin synthase catalytic subunit
MRVVTSTSTLDWVSVASAPLSSADLTAWATQANCGAIVTFCGTVRDNSHDLKNVQALEYETDITLAERRILDVVAETRVRWPMIGAVAVHHRIGRVELSEPAVIVVVSSPHRGQAFDAAQFCIDAVKRCVPMWKREIWEGGSAWSEEGQTIVRVQEMPSNETTIEGKTRRIQ